MDGDIETVAEAWTRAQYASEAWAETDAEALGGVVAATATA